MSIHTTFRSREIPSDDGKLPLKVSLYLSAMSYGEVQDLDNLVEGWLHRLFGSELHNEAQRVHRLVRDKRKHIAFDAGTWSRRTIELSHDKLNFYLF
jgi:hypothetical protein